MSEPTFDTTLERLYQTLPEHFRTADSAFDYGLKRYLSGPTKSLNAVEALIDRFQYTPPEDGGEEDDTSDLVDPYTCNTEWLPWLGQMVGLTNRGQKVTRDEVARAATGFNSGTKEAIIAAGRTALVGDKFITLHDHSASAGPDSGGEWDLLVVTRDLETLRNSYPEWMSTISAATSWVATSPAGGVLKNFAIDEDYDVHKNRLLTFQIAAIPTTNSSITATTDWRGTVAPGNNFQTMLNISLLEGTGSRTGVFGLRYYNTAGAEIGTAQTAITVDDTNKQVVFRGMVPANTTHFATYFTLNGVSDTDIVGIAQLAARSENINTWIAATADVIQSIIDRGAKPAGVILHKRTFAATWDALEVAYPTMLDLEGHTWAEIEENKTDVAILTGFGSGGFGDRPFGD